MYFQSFGIAKKNHIRVVRDKQIRPCDRGIVWSEADNTGCLFEASFAPMQNPTRHRARATSCLLDLRGAVEKTALFILRLIFFSPAALISVSEDISIPNVINIVKPSVVIPSVSVPSTSSWNPSAWGTWPFITISGISGAQQFPSFYSKI